jgi:Aminoacyl tRNA synthetase class II, N-terminal domain
MKSKKIGKKRATTAGMRVSVLEKMISDLHAGLRPNFDRCQTIEELCREQSNIIGANGAMSTFTDKMGALSPTDRKHIGEMLNDLVVDVKQAFEDREGVIERAKEADYIRQMKELESSPDYPQMMEVFYKALEQVKPTLGMADYEASSPALKVRYDAIQQEQYRRTAVLKAHGVLGAICQTSDVNDDLRIAMATPSAFADPKLMEALQREKAYQDAEQAVKDHWTEFDWNDKSRDFDTEHKALLARLEEFGKELPAHDFKQPPAIEPPEIPTHTGYILGSNSPFIQEKLKSFENPPVSSAQEPQDGEAETCP